MKTKLLEVRDRMTFIPVLCIDVNEDVSVLRSYLLRRCGYACDGHPNIVMTRLSADGTPCWSDPYGWADRTFVVAHNYIIEHWHEIDDGGVVDVEFILGETAAPKVSERLTTQV